MEILKMIIKNLLKLILVLAVLGALVFGGIKLYNYFFAVKDPVKEEEQQEAKTPVKVEVLEYVEPSVVAEKPVQPNNTKKLTKTGTILAGQEVAISPEVSATLTSVKVKEGAVVKRGQLLATLGDSVQLKTAQISYNAAIQLLANAEEQLMLTGETGYVNQSTFEEQFALARQNVDKAAIQLESTQIVRYQQEKIQNLQEKLTPETPVATETTRPAADDTEDYQEYLKDKIKDKTDDLEDFQGRVQDDQNEINVASSQIQLSLLSKQMELADLQSATQILNVRNQIVQVRQQVQSAQVSMSLGQVVSPINGVVTSIEANAGEKVNTGQAFMTVTNLDEVNIKIFVSPTELFQLLATPQGKLTAETNVFDVTVPATINYLGMSANSQTKTIPVEVSPRFTDQKAKSRFIPNTFAKVIFSMGTNPVVEIPVDTKPTVNVPVTALKFQNNKILVATAQDNKVAYKAVTLANVKNGKVAIKSGLVAGDQIIVSPKNLAAGRVVTIQ